MNRYRSAILAVVACAGLIACAGPQIHSSTQVATIRLDSRDLLGARMALVTPSTVLGQEEDKQALALVFMEVLRQKRPDLRSVSLPETLGAINRAGLTADYKRMFEDYRFTGILERSMLQKIAQATDVRYIAQLKLAGFHQGAKERWGFLGIRIMETKSTAIRLFLQIWDSRDGTLAWEGAQELTVAHESTAEDIVTFRNVVEEAARQLVMRLP